MNWMKIFSETLPLKIEVTLKKTSSLSKYLQEDIAEIFKAADKDAPAP